MIRRTQKSLLLLLVALGLIFSLAQPCLASSTITISSSGAGVFVLQGVSIENVAAAEINVGYDSASLTNPRVTQGALMSGALLAVNANAPGTVRIAMVTVHPVTGSGVIATLSFDRTSGSSGSIRSLSVKLANIDGRQLSVEAHLIPPVDEPSSLAPSQQDASASTTATTGPSVVRNSSPAERTQGLAIVAGAPAETPKPEQPAPFDSNKQPSSEKTDVQEQIPVPPKESSRADKVETPARNVYAHKSILDRFREFKGIPSQAAYLSLFGQGNLLGFTQEPSAALSDGKTRVKLTFISTPEQRSMSEIALAGGKLIALDKDRDNSNTWIAEILPAKGELSASLSIPQGNMIVVYPLVTAPPVNIDLDGSGKVTEADFGFFLKERGTGNTPKFDLNRDGKRDYIDDYIFAVNYLVSTRAKINK